jgi:hypothetical protein
MIWLDGGLGKDIKDSLRHFTSYPGVQGIFHAKALNIYDRL